MPKSLRRKNWSFYYRLLVVTELYLIYCCCSSSIIPFSILSSAMSPKAGCSDLNNCKTNKPKIIPDPGLQAMPSFYQRKLPSETCVAFASREGKKLFKSALENNGLKSFYNLIEQHHTQTEPAFCGVSTLVLVLNALAVDPGQQWKGPWRWYEETMLNCCIDMEDIKQSGITLTDFQCLAFCQGLSVELQHCDETSSLKEFRRVVERACVEEQQLDDQVVGEGVEEEDNGDDDKKFLKCLVVSYNRKVLKQTGAGHFSPLAAYDAASDSVLILDTARFKYGAHWTKLPLIYEAMKPIDPDTGKSRGYALLSFVQQQTKEDVREEITSTSSSGSINSSSSSSSSSSPKEATALINTNKLSTQPASFLFRSKMNQKGQRRLYKEYIATLLRDEKFKQGDIPYDVVRSYWCEDSGRPMSVWGIIEPMRVNNDEEKEMLRQMRMLLVDMKNATENDQIDKNDDQKEQSTLSARTRSSENTSTTPANHMVTVSAEETLYFIYLATLSEERRNDFVMNFKSEASEVVRKQNIKEVDMIASANFESEASEVVRKQIIKEADMIASAIEVNTTAVNRTREPTMATLDFTTKPSSKQAEHWLTFCSSRTEGICCRHAACS